MRIGILTFHRPVNYGAFLQSFSLSGEIKRRFPAAEVEIIDYIAPREQRKIYLNVLRELKYRGIKSMLCEIKKIKVFEQSLRFLPLSKEHLCTDNISDLYEYISDRYDYLVIGSDAVLNWKQNGYPSAFYPPKECRIPALGYAVSAHGLEYNSITDEQKRSCKDSFGRFCFIGARDSNTVRFIQQNGGTDKLEHVCDPTFFISVESVNKNAGEWKSRISKKYGFNFDGEYVVLMVNDEDITREVYSYYKEKYKVITLFKNTANSDIFMYDLTPFEWVKVLEGAKVVFTQYFHGALLSLVVNTGIIAVDMAGDNSVYESKLHDVIASRMSLPEIYFTKSGAKDTNKLIAAADRVIAGEFSRRIEEAINNERKTSEKFFDELSRCMNE